MDILLCKIGVEKRADEEIDAVCGGFMTTQHLHHVGSTMINRGISDPWIFSEQSVSSFTALIFEILLILNYFVFRRVSSFLGLLFFLLRAKPS